MPSFGNDILMRAFGFATRAISAMTRSGCSTCSKTSEQRMRLNVLSSYLMCSASPTLIFLILFWCRNRSFACFMAMVEMSMPWTVPFLTRPRMCPSPHPTSRVILSFFMFANRRSVATLFFSRYRMRKFGCWYTRSLLYFLNMCSFHVVNSFFDLNFLSIVGECERQLYIRFPFSNSLVVCYGC